MKRSGRKSAAQTPAPKKEQVYGSEKNTVGSAASRTSATNIKLSEKTVDTLQDKAEKYNETHSKKVSTSTLKAVMRRGMGAYSKSHRPTITGGAPNSRQAWGFARVNKFLKKKAGQQVKKAYVQDDDLLKDGGELTLLAPNGRKSNLTPEQYKLVRTPEFKAWFGDWENDPENASKVMDENGEPLVVYHGTVKNFYAFRNIPHFFSKSKKVAETYSRKVLELFLNIRTPFVYDANCNEYTELYGMVDRLQDAIREVKEEKKDVTFNIWGEYKILKETDGIIIKNIVDTFFTSEDEEINDEDYEKWLKKWCSVDYITSNSNQIKLADGTNTTFDSNNPDIRFKNGGMTKDLPVGRLAKGMSLKDIADHHNVKVSELEPELKLGVKTEMEHTYDPKIAEAIAFDHLFEDPKYYTHLSQMEMRAEGNRLEDYYASGGHLVSGTCKELDENGETLTDRESLARMTKCLETLPQTKSLHFDPIKNDYTPERKKLHRKIIFEFKKDLICVENDSPIAILMGGSPASGKSTFLKKYAPYLLKTEILKVDADEIRAMLPEYEGYNASQTHLETKDIVNTLLSDRNIGIPCRFDVIYDGTMNNTKSYLPLINLLKSLGYKVFIVYIDKVPKDVVVNRSIERYKKSGRFVPLEVIDDFFEKGTEALEKLKSQVDGYMIVDGSDTEYRVIEKGGMKLPKNRNYSKIGEPIRVTESEIVSEFKRGGQINPDNAQIKSAITHKAGSAGGLLVGNRHSEGGIKAINKSTGQPLEMEGGEVVITRDAVSDNTKREFEGEMLTNRQILSRINESGGGVSFADGGDVPHSCACKGKEFKYGGKMMRDNDIVNEIMSSSRKSFGISYPELPYSEAIEKLFSPVYKMEEGGEVYGEGGLIRLINKRVPSFKSYSEQNKETNQLAIKRTYKEFLKSKFGIDFHNLPQSLQVGLLLGNQKLVDNYLNS